LDKNNKSIINHLDFSNYLEAAPNINRAVTSILENSIAIFLPYKRIDLSKANITFAANDRTLEIKNELFEKLEIKGRLLGQIHKDVLEAILSTKKTFDQEDTYFKVRTTAYKLLQKMHRDTSDKQWLLKQIEHISQSRIKIYYTDTNTPRGKETFDFAFISSIRTMEDGKSLEINFTKEYTYFLALNELIDYSAYIDDIMSLKKDIQKIEREIKQEEGVKFKNGGINQEFIKAVVRYVLTHNGKNSQIRINNLIEKLNLKKVMSDSEIDMAITDLRRTKIQKLLKNKFGITLTNENKTITFNIPEKKSKQHLQPSLEL
jgi:hypothetical protein